MKREDYQTPTMQVVELQQQAHLLAGSNEVDALSPFTSGGDPLNP